MNDDLYLFRRHTKEAASLYDFEPFIHQGGGVNGDTLPHLPGGVIQGLLHRNRGKLRVRCVQEWPAGSGEPDGLDLLHTPAAQALVHRIVLAIYGKQRLVVPPRLRGEQLAGGHHTFLVGQADSFSGFYCFVGGFQAGHADDGADHEIYFRMGRNLYCAGRAMDDLDFAQAIALKTRAQLPGVLLGGYRKNAWAPSPGLLVRGFQVLARRQGEHTKSLRVRLHDGKRAAPDGTGGAQDGEGFHQQLAVSTWHLAVEVRCPSVRYPAILLTP